MRDGDTPAQLWNSSSAHMAAATVQNLPAASHGSIKSRPPTDADGAAGDGDEAEEREHQARLAAAGAPHHAAADAALRAAELT